MSYVGVPTTSSIPAFRRKPGFQPPNGGSFMLPLPLLVEAKIKMDSGLRQHDGAGSGGCRHDGRAHDDVGLAA